MQKNKLLGLISIISSLMLLFFYSFFTIGFAQFFSDGFFHNLYLVLGLLSLFIVGILYLKKQDLRSIKLLLLSLIFQGIIPLLLFSYISFANKDPLGFVLAIPFIYLGSAFAIINLIVEIISRKGN
jgi:hypothetical protein